MSAPPASHESKGMPKLRLNALRVLCEELRNPFSAGETVRAGVCPILTTLATKPENKETREAASKALCALAVDSNGRASMTENKSAVEVLSALSDASPIVRSNIYDALVNYSAVREGVNQLVEAGYAPVLVEKAGKETDDVRHMPLNLLYNACKNENGLKAALESNAVEVCIENLGHKDSLVKHHAAATLGFLCFADSAKVTAIQNQAVEMLSELLADHFWKVRASAASALMSIMQTDAGKKSFVSCEGAVGKLVKLLKDKEDLVKINALKAIACAAVHPEARREMKESSDCLPVIHQIVDGGDPFMSKHASLAKDAVLWEP
ncbi:hypothetical protein TrLO_g14417 [Triparma laevis f. longispina]|uniref:Uncharacterized protein n=1 Tax=Triparma laevis f. longispina TaxID=1714387 RepID=A0A9W7F659_9STRA|nr:hypothetical protein TrLO_g14417 [Triparma laevis f. longispina]